MISKSLIQKYHVILVFAFALGLFQCGGDPQSISNTGDNDLVDVPINQTEPGSNTSSELSLPSGHCYYGDYVPVKSFAEGQDQVAIVCAKDDWWLPESVQDSSYGGVTAAGGLYDGFLETALADSVRVGPYWYNLEDFDGTNFSLKTGPGTLDHILGKIQGSGKKYNLYLTDQASGSSSPAALKVLHPTLNLMRDELFARKARALGVYQNDLKEKGVSGATLLEKVMVRDAELAQLILKWDDILFSRLESRGGFTYAWWDQNYIDERKKFHVRLYRYLTRFNTLNEDMLSTMSNIPLTGENCMLGQYLYYSFLTPSEIDIASRKLVRTTLNIGIPPQKFKVALCGGGRAYKELAEMAAEHGLSVGSHGANNTFMYTFNQHLKNLEYNSTLQTYVPTGEFPYGGIKHDITKLRQGENTFWRYRWTRFATLAAIAHQTTDIIYEREWLESLEYPNRSIDTAIHHSKIKTEKPSQFVAWVNKTIARPADDSVEAFCSLTQVGQNMPLGKSFDDELKKYKDTDQVPFTSGYNAYTFNWSYKEYWPRYLAVPVVTHFGHHCQMDITVENGKGMPQHRLIEELVDDGSEVDLSAPLALDFTGASFGGDCDDETCVYEGRSTENHGSETGGLYFRLNQNFKKGQSYLVKVTFLNPSKKDGQFALEYDSTDGWKQTSPVHFGAGQDDYHTATFKITDAAFNQGGPKGYQDQGTDLAIKYVSGEHAVYTMIRVIKIES